MLGRTVIPVPAVQFPDGFCGEIYQNICHFLTLFCSALCGVSGLCSIGNFRKIPFYINAIYQMIRNDTGSQLRLTVFAEQMICNRSFAFTGMPHAVPYLEGSFRQQLSGDYPPFRLSSIAGVRLIFVEIA